MKIDFEKIQKTIEDLVRNGDHKSAHLEIKRLIKKNKLTSQMRFHFSIWYLNLDDPNKALKVLGKELNEFEIKKSTAEQKRLQMRLAFVLSLFGAHQSAARIINKVFQTFPANSSDNITLYRYMGTIFFRNYQYAEALKSFQMCKQQAKQRGNYHSYLSAVNQIAIADCLDALGESQKAIETILEIKTWWEEVPVNVSMLIDLSLGEYYLRAFNFSQAEQYLKSAQNLLSGLSKDQAFVKKWIGVLHLLTGENQQATTVLKHTQNEFMRIDHNTTSILEIVFWRYLNKDLSFNDPEFWPLLLHPLILSFSQMLISQRSPLYWKNFYLKAIPDVLKMPQMAPQMIYYIEGGRVLIGNYTEVVEKNKNSCLDLVSGFWISKKGSILELSPIEYQVLHLLARAGIYGVSIYTLIDLVYSQELSDPSSMSLRIEQVIQRIRKHGINIVRKKNILILVQTFNTIIPQSIDFQPDPIMLLCRMEPKFAFSQISKKYKMAISKLNRLLKPHLISGALLKLDGENYKWKQAVEIKK